MTLHQTCGVPVIPETDLMGLALPYAHEARGREGQFPPERQHGREFDLPLTTNSPLKGAADVIEPRARPPGPARTSCDAGVEPP